MPTTFTFTPPTDNTVGPITDYFGNTPADADKAMLHLMAHYRPTARGRNVYLMNDNSLSEQQPPNWDGTTFESWVISEPNLSTQQPYAFSFTYAGGVNPPNGVTMFTNLPNLQVKRIFWGGHPNPVTEDEAELLIAAGYTVTSSGRTWADYNIAWMDVDSIWEEL